MDIAKLRKLKPAEVTKEIAEVMAKIVELRAEIAMHRVKNWHVLKTAKQYLARLLTIQQEHEIINKLSNE
ncbi:TPA: 50S ribosomal protein L29 [Patescibacteria group bacterium]|uniref:Large ribosomal subunit protein uL29 n=1 Tax=candidate division Kazan bacterium GW2011_GWA1_44_22 TaxID=1620410 RepID=A0A0G1I0H7_UNCK3|nr:MAG: hypothetical protein VE96_C0005G0020 [candidate division Kazan bacterium GW2011_GWA1_44_22]HAR55027.1 50S ribosomal protein L29 [Patescibacteria group bacterium]